VNDRGVALLLCRRRTQQLEAAARHHGVDGGVACASPLCGLHDYHVAQYAHHLGAADLAALPGPVAGSSKSAACGGIAATSPAGAVEPGYATTENDYFQTWQLQRHAAAAHLPTTPRRPPGHHRAVPPPAVLPVDAAPGPPHSAGARAL